MNRSPKAFLSAALLALGVAAAPAMAQSATPAPPPALSEPTDAQLQKFVQASEKVAVVAQTYQPKITASPDENTRQQMIQEADQEMIQRVTADGLTVDEFIGINEALQQDPALRERVMELAKKSGG